VAQQGTSQLISVFFSYSHKDQALRDRLETHLAMLKRQGIIATWHDRKIIAGDPIDDSIGSELEAARIILLLVSADFLASDYCYGKEMEKALERHASGKTRVIPIILRPCEWREAPFRHLLTAPTDGVPVTNWKDPEEAFLDITRMIRAALVELGTSSSIRESNDATDRIQRLIKETKSSGMDAIQSPNKKWARVGAFSYPLAMTRLVGFLSPTNRLGVSVKDQLLIWDPDDNSLKKLLDVPVALRGEHGILAGDGLTTLHGSDDGDIIVVEAKPRVEGSRHKETDQLVAHKSRPVRAQFCPGGSRLVSVDEKGYVIVWDWASRTVLLSFRTLVGRVTGISFGHRDDSVVVISESGDIEVFDMLTGRSKKQFHANIGGKCLVQFSLFDEHIIAHDDADRWDGLLYSSGLRMAPTELIAAITSAVSDKQGKLVVMQTASGHVFVLAQDIIEAAKYAFDDLFPPLDLRISDVQISDDGQYVGLLIERRALHIWQRVN